MRILFFILFAIVIVIAVIGLLLPNPRVSTKSTQLAAQIDMVWEKVTNYRSQPNWRKDLEKVEVNEALRQWTEIPKVGPNVTLKEREKRTPSLYTVEIVPVNGFSGYSTIELEANSKGTKLTITEISEVSNPFRRVLSFIFYNQSEHMDMYLENLRNALEHN
ncbi:SRPBCC family protein [Sedimenticola thiotaurini]|uniref:SRPBCC family protein n=1 Tax=Sedimenticola thiotaurini TaxID=1543721 RepID=UPI0009E5A805|nr:SRPBCC family protein [Sedimenticola thiotaurini]